MDLVYYVPKIHKRSKTLIRGIGVNDMKISTKIVVDGELKKCPIYDIWVHMLERCTEEYQERNIHYAGTTVCEEWKFRSKFHEWMVARDWVDKAIDKDILYPDNTTYCPEKCCLVPQAINNLLTDRKNHDRKTPLGVTFDKSKNKYVAQCNMNGKKSVKVGTFNDPLSAHYAYQLAKAKEIERVAELYFRNGDITLEVREALLMRSDLLKSHAKQGIITESIHHFSPT